MKAGRDWLLKAYLLHGALLVVNEVKRLVGVVSLANIASVNTDKLRANLLRGVAGAH